MKIKRLLFLSIFILTINIVMATPVSVNGKLKVVGLQLTNECGNAVQLRGVSTHGLQYYPLCFPDAALNFAASASGMGADVVRIAMYVDEGGYLSDPTSFTNQVDALVDKIGALGMYAIIDWHVLTPGDPNAHIAEARTFWQHEATQHKGKKYVLYEICNEPNGVAWSVVKTYADDIIPKIRAIDPDTVIICGTPVWSQLGADVVNSPLSYTNIMYTFHFYAASHSTALLTPYVGSLPIFSTEWAATTSSGSGTLDTANATNFINIMGGANSAGVKISWCSWSYSDANELSAMFNVNSCSGNTFDTGHLSTEGNYVRNNILTPGKTFIVCGTATNTPVINTPTFTFTRTRTVTPVNTASMTYTRTNTPTITPSFTVSRSVTPSGTVTSTATKTITPVNTATSSFTATPSFTMTNTQVNTNTSTPTLIWTGTLTPSRTLISTPTNTPYYSPSVTASSTQTHAGTLIDTVTLTVTLSATLVPADTWTKTPANTATFVNTPVNTATNTRTIVNTSTRTPQPVATATSTITLTIGPAAVPTATIIATPIKMENTEKTYPNPFNPDKDNLHIVYNLESDSDNVRLLIYTKASRKIMDISLNTGTVRAGYAKGDADAANFRNLSSGIYYYVIKYATAHGEKKSKVKPLYIVR